MPMMMLPNGENEVNEIVNYMELLFGYRFLNRKDRLTRKLEIRPWDEDPDVVIDKANVS